MPELSVPNIIKDFELLLLCGIVGITSPGVCVDGVEGAELGEGPAVLAVPELLAGPEDDTGCFLFLPVWFFEALKCMKHHVRNPFINQTEKSNMLSKYIIADYYLIL